MNSRFLKLFVIAFSLILLNSSGSKSQNEIPKISLVLKNADLCQFLYDYSSSIEQNIIMSCDTKKAVDETYTGLTNGEILRKVIKNNGLDFAEFGNILLIGNKSEIFIAKELLKKNPFKKLRIHKIFYLDYHEIKADEMTNMLFERINRFPPYMESKIISVRLEAVDWSVIFHSLCALTGYKYSINRGTIELKQAVETPYIFWHYSYDLSEFNPSDFILMGIRYDLKKENRRIYYVFLKNGIPPKPKYGLSRSGTKMQTSWLPPYSDPFYKEGDQLGDATVKSIEQDRVIFQKGNELIEVKLK